MPRFLKLIPGEDDKGVAIHASSFSGFNAEDPTQERRQYNVMEMEQER